MSEVYILMFRLLTRMHRCAVAFHLHHPMIKSTITIILQNIHWRVCRHAIHNGTLRGDYKAGYTYALFSHGIC